jgi:hypothetical protein
MVAFVPAKVLKEKYEILGNFYSVEITPNCIIECRNVLEIVAKPLTAVQIRAIPNRKPDAVFVMMNPGSSQPLVEVDYRIKTSQIAELSISLVPTKPDTTQYQVMRVMHCHNLQHVRVLNLSDLRCTKSPLFIQQFKRLEAEHSFDAHSLFSALRRTELKQQMLKFDDIPVVRAWGVSPHLEPLIERCEKSLRPMRKLSGLLKDGTANKYLHPLPSLQKQQEEWVNRMIGLWSGQFTAGV